MDWLTDKEDEALQATPRSQQYDEFQDVALLKSCFPHMLRFFSDADAIKLMALGLRDVHVILCAEHGLSKISILTSEEHPVDQVMRMAAHMSGVDFTRACQSLQTVRKTYALPLMFLELDQLLLITACPKNASLKMVDELDASNVITEPARP